MRPRRLKKQSNNGEDQYCEFDKLISGCLLAGIHTKNVGWRAIHDRVKDMGLTRTQQHLQPGAFVALPEDRLYTKPHNGSAQRQNAQYFFQLSKAVPTHAFPVSDTGQCEAKRVG